MRPPKNVFSKNLRLADTKEISKITTPTRDEDDDDQRPPPFTSSLLPPQEGMNCWMATWEPVNRQQSRYHKSQGAHLDCCRFSPEVVPFEKKWYDHHNSRSTTIVLPLATLTSSRGSAIGLRRLRSCEGAMMDGGGSVHHRRGASGGGSNKSTTANNDSSSSSNDS